MRQIECAFVRCRYPIKITPQVLQGYDIIILWYLPDPECSKSARGKFNLPMFRHSIFAAHNTSGPTDSKSTASFCFLSDLVACGWDQIRKCYQFFFIRLNEDQMANWKSRKYGSHGKIGIRIPQKKKTTLRLKESFHKNFLVETKFLILID